jgi:hypothetical protein
VPALSCGGPGMLGIVGKIENDQCDKNCKDSKRRQDLLIEYNITSLQIDEVHPPAQVNLFDFVVYKLI